MLLAISSALMIAAVLFISSPAIVYFGSDASDFPLRLSSYLGFFLFLSVGFVLLVALLCRVAGKRGQRPVAFIMAFLAIIISVEAFVLLPDFGAFTGGAVDWTISPIRFAFEGCAAIFALFIVRQWVTSPTIPSVLFLVLAIVVSMPAILGAVNETKPAAAKVQRSTLFGVGEKNLLIVLLDGFPSDVFEEIVEKRAELRDVFSGFTYFPDTVGVSSTTFLALPSIHSGRVYSSGTALQPFFKRAVKDESFMGLLSDSGFSSVLINPLNGGCPRQTECTPALLVLNDYQDVRMNGMARLLGLSLFRAAPLALKTYIYDDGRWLFTRLAANPRSFDHNSEGVEILKTFANNVTLRGSKPTVKFLHLLTPHLPVVFGAGCTHSATPIPATREAFLTQAECSLSAFATVVESLKARGLYDKTAIVLLSDHGQGYPNRKVDGEGDWTKMSGSANPLLVIKPLGAAGPMQVSDQPRWLPEIPSIACNLTAACVLDPITFTSGRTFNYYEWKNEYWTAEQIPLKPYLLSGAPWESSSWTSMERKTN